VEEDQEGLDGVAAEENPRRMEWIKDSGTWSLL